jgi:hypothetical protein
LWLEPAGVANNAVTYAKMQGVSAASRLLGRGSASAGDPQEMPCRAPRRVRPAVFAAGAPAFPWAAITSGKAALAQVRSGSR